jgi:hypothetical protein
MPSHSDNKYTINSKILDLQSRVLALETANKELKLWLLGELQTRINDSQNVIQGAQESDFRELKASVKNGVDGRNGVDGATGPQGAQGVPGDVTYITPVEVEAQVQALRLKLAKWQAAVQFAYEQNYGTKHRGLKVAIDSILKTIENQAK